MKIKVLGTGCAKCRKLEQIVREAVREIGVEAEIEKISDVREIAKTGVMMTPGLMIDGEVKLSGKVPNKAEINKIITASMDK